jgi:hypothetical protein
MDMWTFFMKLYVRTPHDGAPTELVIDGCRTRVIEDIEKAIMPFTGSLEEVDNWERRLAAIVGEEEVFGGGFMTP